MIGMGERIVLNWDFWDVWDEHRITACEENPIHSPRFQPWEGEVFTIDFSVAFSIYHRCHLPFPRLKPWAMEFYGSPANCFLPFKS